MSDHSDYVTMLIDNREARQLSPALSIDSCFRAAPPEPESLSLPP